MSADNTAAWAAAGLGGVVGALGLGTLVYANQVELNRFTLRHAEITVADLPAELRVLHISDIHYVRGQQRKYRWLQQLADLEPDLVVNTGDNLSDRQAVPEVLEALGPLLQFPGCFVPGSNDYYAPRFKNPLKYFKGPSTLHPSTQSLPTEELFGGFETAGWANLTNAHSSARFNGLEVEFSGVDDPHLQLDEFSGWPSTDAQPKQPADLKIGVAHAPVRRVLETFADSGADAVFAGHTHGGQVCLPAFDGSGGHALVTNCDLPPRYAKGLHTLRGAHGSTEVHVSAGIGTSAMAPVRLFCPPEATLVTIGPEQR
ncbi:metallophosphoesterase [Nesterenkonia ebinurensis]|uniref:metallophosphoesterase n=1 Tax=Nesterenkonia ebinurensis TaxID=2608252 RepID=UPI00123D409D|nr:metallophosphoesterase [Nesterenkonia ebinurensis]